MPFSDIRQAVTAHCLDCAAMRDPSVVAYGLRSRLDLVESCKFQDCDFYLVRPRKGAN